MQVLVWYVGCGLLCAVDEKGQNLQPFAFVPLSWWRHWNRTGNHAGSFVCHQE